MVLRCCGSFKGSKGSPTESRAWVVQHYYCYDYYYYYYCSYYYYYSYMCYYTSVSLASACASSCWLETFAIIPVTRNGATVVLLPLVALKVERLGSRESQYIMTTKHHNKQRIKPSEMVPVLLTLPTNG